MRVACWWRPGPSGAARPAAPDRARESPTVSARKGGSTAFSGRIYYVLGRFFWTEADVQTWLFMARFCLLACNPLGALRRSPSFGGTGSAAASVFDLISGTSSLSRSRPSSLRLRCAALTGYTLRSPRGRGSGEPNLCFDWKAWVS